MSELADPLDESLHAHPEAGVLDAPESAGIEVPVVGLRILALFEERLLDRLEVGLPLAPADDLADPVAADHVEPEDEVGMFRVACLVERLRDSRVMRDDDRLRLAFGQRPLLERAKVLAPLHLDALRLEHLQGLIVRHALEGRLDGLQEFRRAA